jgi:hypothetical protein
VAERTRRETAAQTKAQGRGKRGRPRKVATQAGEGPADKGKGDRQRQNAVSKTSNQDNIGSGAPQPSVDVAGTNESLVDPALKPWSAHVPRMW